MPGFRSLLHTSAILSVAFQIQFIAAAQTPDATTPRAPGSTTATVSPATGTSLAQSFTFTFTNSAGAASITRVQALFAAAIGTSGVCQVNFDNTSGNVSLLNDSGLSYLGPVSLGSPGLLQNSQCAIDLSRSSAVSSGNTLTLRLAVTFPGTYGGAKNIFAEALDITGDTGFTQVGTWNVAGGGYVFTQFDVPNSSITLPQSISNDGKIVGTYRGPDGFDHGFLRSPTGTFTFIDIANASNTQPTGVNNAGQIAGNYFDNNGARRSFLRAANGTVTLTDLLSGGVLAQGINDNGQIVGQFANRGILIQSNNSTSLMFDVPNSATPSGSGPVVATLASGINNAAQIAGSYVASPTVGGFIRNPDGTFVTYAGIGKSINDSGQVVGLQSNSGFSPGFLRDTAGNTIGINYPNNSKGLDSIAVNNSGQIAGSYSDGFALHGFTATPCTTSISPSGFAHGGGAETGTVVVTAPSNCSWTSVPDSGGAVTFPGGTTGTGSATITYNVAANPNSGGRTLQITIAGQPYTITQGAVLCAFNLSSTGVTANANGDNGVVSFSGLSGCTWTAVSNNPDWLTITSAASGTGSSSITWNALANPTSNTRTGSLIIGGSTFTVTQGPSTSCIFQLVPSPSSFSQAGGSGQLTINTGLNCSWTVTSNSSWLHIPVGGSGFSTATIGFTVDANTGTDTRNGSFSINGANGAGISQTGTSGVTTIRVNAGGGLYVDPSNQTFSGDFGYSGGITIATGVTISGTQQQNVYQTQRQSSAPLTYQFTAANGSYNVNLKFAEIAGAVVGQRQFNVSINGSQVLTNFDINATAGGQNVAVDRQFPVNVTNGQVTIVLTPVLNAVSIAGIEIIPTGVQSQGLRFVAVTPCRIADTRLSQGLFGGSSLVGGLAREFPIPSGGCGIPFGASAYSVNITAVPKGPLSYLTAFPTGQTRPNVSTLNSFNGRVVANAAIVPAGTNGSISLFATDNTDAIIDINGYFTTLSATATLEFYKLTPCRVSDTRIGSGPFGGPALGAGATRTIPLLQGVCGIPANAQAVSLNVTAVPSGPLSYLTIWPDNNTAQPIVSTLNSFNGSVVANAAIVPVGATGVNVFVTDPSNVILDVNGYFAPPAAAGLQFYTTTPCRISDSRNPNGSFGGPSLAGGETRLIPVLSSSCNLPSTAQAYALNVTVVPPGPLSYLTLYPTGSTQPLVSTLNSFTGDVVANAAIVPAGLNGVVSAFVTNPTDLITDINGYFAP